ncbi:hypothetical protein [Sporosarcina sp. JAI121]|uniref:hypothetical protein n=1 Tax=Sporosarcina sp. JAI121 TaxID=2723064 RepID=UPI0015CEDF65|nr:hypothetical protein [Sporosarcina sp. JAI121]NYF23424.1 sporulation-control protein spo0M [Sporosarcina sp. JAI121]
MAYMLSGFSFWGGKVAGEIMAIKLAVATNYIDKVPARGEPKKPSVVDNMSNFIKPSAY